MADNTTGMDLTRSNTTDYPFRYSESSLPPPSVNSVSAFEQAMAADDQPKTAARFPTSEEYQEALSWSEGQSLESAKARMAFVQPLVEMLIPDIQGIGNNAIQAQQSWQSGQSLSAASSAGAALMGAIESVPALKAAKVAGKADNIIQPNTRERAQEIHAVLDARAQRQRTTAEAYTILPTLLQLSLGLTPTTHKQKR
jgi:hypothetical protein